MFFLIFDCIGQSAFGGKDQSQVKQIQHKMGKSISSYNWSESHK